MHLLLTDFFFYVKKKICNSELLKSLCRLELRVVTIIWTYNPYPKSQIIFRNALAFLNFLGSLFLGWETGLVPQDRCHAPIQCSARRKQLRSSFSASAAFPSPVTPISSHTCLRFTSISTAPAQALPRPPEIARVRDIKVTPVQRRPV